MRRDQRERRRRATRSHAERRPQTRICYPVRYPKTRTFEPPPPHRSDPPRPDQRAPHTLCGRDGEHPGAGRQLGWHIHHMLTIGHKPVRDVPADALASLNRPHPPRPPSGLRQHPAYPAASVAYRPRPATASSPAMTSIVAVRLCGSIPMTTWLISVLPTRPLLWLPGKGEGTATSSRTNPS
jgi:hypothetical protein